MAVKSHLITFEQYRALQPPGHPAREYVLLTGYGIMGFDYASTFGDSVPYAHDVALALTTWLTNYTLASPEVQAWVREVQDHFWCWWASVALNLRERWIWNNLQFDDGYKTYPGEAATTSPLDRHIRDADLAMGTHWIRLFFPGYVPSRRDFAGCSYRQGSA